MTLRKLLLAAAVAAVAIPAVGYAGWSSQSGLSVQKRAELYSITQIEAKFHKAASKKSLRMMMSIWAPKSTATIGGVTYSGKAAIRKVYAKAGPFQPQNHWISDTAAYKIRVTVNGTKATLYFECHYIDVDTGKVAATTGADLDLRKINGKWLITNFTAASTTLTP